MTPNDSEFCSSGMAVPAHPCHPHVPDCNALADIKRDEDLQIRSSPTKAKATNLKCRMEKSGPSRRAHNPEFAGSNPAPATNVLRTPADRRASEKEALTLARLRKHVAKLEREKINLHFEIHILGDAAASSVFQRLGEIAVLLNDFHRAIAALTVCKMRTV